ncbi:MAG: histidine phosphatase family protein [Deltaproteobacteria bacterium]|nr:histidine phosphatase family protein [Deltaproteobacteria bacterium]
MKGTNRLYLIRHGQVEGFERFPIYGRTDVEVTEVGRVQMEALAERLRHVRIDAVFSSDLRRSLVGARIIGRYHDAPIRSLPELREMDFGAWEGLTLEDIRERFPEELEKREKDVLGYRIPGGGESLGGFAQRILSCMKAVLEKREGEDILLVAHGLVNRVLICDALGLDFSRIFVLHQGYGCLNIIDYFSDAALVRLVNG